MKKDTITRLTLPHNTFQSIYDVFSGGVRVLAVVQKNCHMLLLKPVAVLEVLFDVEGIIVTTTELAILTNVIDPDKHGSFGTPTAWIYHMKGLFQINNAARRELWILVCLVNWRSVRNIAIVTIPSTYVKLTKQILPA